MTIRQFLVDMSNVSHRVRNTHLAELSNGIIYGTLRSLLHFEQWARSMWPGDSLQLVLCYDASNRLRREIYPDYKGNRVKAKSDSSLGSAASFRDFYEQTDKLRLIVERLQLNVGIADGYECDDVIAQLALSAHDGKYVYICSHDKDMHQCLSKYCRIVKHMHNGLYCYTTADLLCDFACEPHMWHQIQALTGDGVDNIPGVHGVSVNTAVKYLDGILRKGKKFDDIERFVESEQYLINLMLTKFPAPGIEGFQFTKRKHDTIAAIDDEAWNDMCLEFGMQSLKRKTGNDTTNSATERFEL